MLLVDFQGGLCRGCGEIGFLLKGRVHGTKEGEVMTNIEEGGSSSANIGGARIIDFCLDFFFDMETKRRPTAINQKKKSHW